MQSNTSSVIVAGPRPRQQRRGRITGRLVWGGLLRVLQRVTHYKHGDYLEFKLNFSVRDLVSDKGRAVRDQVEALVQAVQKAGSYQAKDEAARAVHAVLDVLKDRVPPDALAKLSESSAVREVARLGRAAGQRLQKDEDKAQDSSLAEACSNTTLPQDGSTLEGHEGGCASGESEGTWSGAAREVRDARVRS